MDHGYVMHGELAPWLSQSDTAALFRNAGFKVDVGKHSVRIDACSIFSFESFGLGEPCIECDADDLETMLADLKRVSEALTVNGIRHRFEVYASDGGEQLAYFHDHWPQ